MWWTVLMLSSAMLVTARTREESSSEEFGLSPYNSRDVYDNKEMWNPRYQRDLFGILNFLDEGVDSSEPKISRKRGLAALTQLKPLADLGKVREKNLPRPKSPFGGRPLGQPLRWGKKR